MHLALQVLRPTRRTWACLLSWCALLPLGAGAQTVTQNFETWPETSNFAAHAYADWLFSDGEVRPSRGGFGTPLDEQCGWLNDADITSNTWLRSPLMPYGVNSVTFNVRPGTDSSGEQFYEVQQSPDGTNWVTVQTYDRLNVGWSTESAAVGIQTPVYIRIRKTADVGALDYLGLDNIQVVPPPGVVLSDLSITPPAPTVATPVHVYVNAQPGPTASNVLVSARYRPGTSGVFTAIGMTNLNANSYRTLTPIPAGFNGTVQYYIHCTYDGPGDSPVFFPAAGPLSPSSFDTGNPFISTSLRQLDPSTRFTPLIISEIMYHPRDSAGTNALEFVELFNTEPVETDLSGFQLAGDIAYTFPLGTTLGPREFLVVAADPAALAGFHGIGNVQGPFTGSLPNAGGQVLLLNREGAILLDVEYSDDTPWPVAADGFGPSLYLSRPDYGESDALAWSASRTPDGTPGTAELLPPSPLDAVVINEFLAHTDLPDVDYVELYNASTQIVDISGCSLSDSPNTNLFYVPPGTLLAPRGFVVFTDAVLGFALSSRGEDLVLRAPDGQRVLDIVRYPAQRNGIASGRYPDGASGYSALAVTTPGSPNAATVLRIEEVVINEIMFNPVSGDDDDEYVELHNRGTGTVDISHWRFTDGITYSMPAGTTIPAGGFLAVARNLERLRSRHPHLNAVNSVGNFSGSLANSGERLVLARPDNPALPDIDFVTIDEVQYGDDSSWGHWIDGGGSSLELIDARSDNRLAMNWAGSDESAKAEWTSLSYTGIVDMGTGTPNQMRLYFLQGGECAVDDVLIRDSGNNTLLSENFEGGAPGWLFYGNHSRTVLGDTSGVANSKGLVVRSTGQGNEGTWSGWSEAFWNHVGAPLLGVPANGTPVSISGKFRWQAGWPHMAFVLRGFWVEAPVTLRIPLNLGSPGLPNSRTLANQAPAIGDLIHMPVLPATGQPIVVTCTLHDPDGISSAMLHYRVDPSLTLTTLAMNDSGTGGDVLGGDGRYSATIPAQAAGARVAFHVTAGDGSATNRYPAAGLPGWPAREAVVRIGDPNPAGVLGTYRLWMTEASINRWLNISGSVSKYSNEPIDITFVVGDYRVIHNAGARWRGLWRGYNQPYNSGAYSIEFPVGERFMGDNEIKLDQIGQNGGDSTRQQEGFCFWMAGRIGVPGPTLRYVRVIGNGVDRGVLHDLQIPSRDLAGRWFADDDPTVYKNTGWVGDPFELRIDGAGQYKQSLYRWNLQKKSANSPNDDYAPTYALAHASATVNKSAYLARMQALLDVRNWTAFFAICGATAAWDHYGWSFAHNSYIHMPSDRGATIFIYDMDHVGGGLTLFPNSGVLLPKMYQTQHAPFRREYWKILKELTDGPMTASASNARLDAWYAAFIANGINVSAPTGWKSFLASARSTIMGQLAPYNVGFAITTNGGLPFSTTNTIVAIGGRAPLALETLAINGIRQRLTFTNETAWTTDIGLAAGTNVLNIAGYDWRGYQVATGVLAVTLNSTPPAPTGHVVISEIMYQPVVENGEYVEIYNRSGHTFDLRGWRLNGADLVFDGGTILRPGQYAVMAQNLTTYQQTYSNAEAVVAQFLGALDDGGETLTLQQPDGSGGWIDVNKVRYDDDPPWPQEAAGGGQALQLIDVNQDNSLPGNWGVTPAPEPAWKYAEFHGTVPLAHPSVITNATLHFWRTTAGGVQVDQVVLVTGLLAEVGANLLANGDFEAPLSNGWTGNGNHAGSYLTSTNPHAGAGSLRLIATGPGVAGTNAVSQRRSLAGHTQKPITLSFWYREEPAGGTLTASMSFTTLEGSVDLARPPQPTTDFRSPGGPSSMAETLPALPPLRINEVMPLNVGAWADGMGDFDPWIEIYNAGTASVSLAGCALSNDPTQPGLWTFPTSTVVAANGYLLVWADAEPGESTPSDPHATFRLDPTNGTVVISLAHEDAFVALDSLTYGILGADYSWGSYPDGDPLSRQIFHTPTPGFANDPQSEEAMVVINEWMAENDSTIQDPTDSMYDDWFELYNPTDSPVNLAGYYLTDTLTQTNKFRIPGGYVIQPHGFLLVWADDGQAFNTGSGPLHVSFRLSNNGEAIGLFRPDGTLMDSVVFASMQGDLALGSWPDGDPTVYTMIPPTPGTANRVLMVSALPPSPADQFRVNWLAQSGQVYDVLGTTNLIPAAWSILATVTADAAVVIFTDTNPPSPAAFYRLLQQD